MTIVISKPSYSSQMTHELSRPRGAWAFHEFRRYHTRPLRLKWGPENVHFRKTHFWEPNINVRILTAQKMVQSSKNAEK